MSHINTTCKLLEETENLDKNNEQSWMKRI